jgi:hypothetical protein
MEKNPNRAQANGCALFLGHVTIGGYGQTKATEIKSRQKIGRPRRS